MATKYPHRLTLVVPTARKAALLTWMRSNLDPNATLNVGGNATGDEAQSPTHWLWSGSLTNQEFKQLFGRLLIMANLALPLDWDTMTRSAQRQWLGDQRQAILSATGVLVDYAANDSRADTGTGWLDNLLISQGIRKIRRAQT